MCPRCARPGRPTRHTQPRARWCGLRTSAQYAASTRSRHTKRFVRRQWCECSPPGLQMFQDWLYPSSLVIGVGGPRGLMRSSSSWARHVSLALPTATWPGIRRRPGTAVRKTAVVIRGAARQRVLGLLSVPDSRSGHGEDAPPSLRDDLTPGPTGPRICPPVRAEPRGDGPLPGSWSRPAKEETWLASSS